MADNSGNVNEKRGVGTLAFTRTSTAELTNALKAATKLDDIFVCAWNRLSHRFAPLNLQLPPKYELTHHLAVFDVNWGGEFLRLLHLLMAAYVWPCLVLALLGIIVIVIIIM